MKNLAKTWLLLIAVPLMKCSSAVALPDQKVPELIKWANQETILSGLQSVEKYTGGYEDFFSEIPLHSEPRFSVFLDKHNRVDSERISLSGIGTDINFQNPLLDTSENLILSIWGEAVLTDLLQASQIRKNNNTKWYEGSEYNYKISVYKKGGKRDVSISIFSKRFPLPKRIEIADWCSIPSNTVFCEGNRDFILQQMNDQD